jgi:hypothetical protein
MALESWSDTDIRDALEELAQEDDTDVTAWEAEFIDSVCFQNGHLPLTDEQRAKAVEILDPYGKD